jgi:phosphotriesterase-related protein
VTARDPLITVLGARVPPGGAIDAHGHLWIDPVVNAADGAAPVLADEEQIVHELASFRAAGGAVVVDCQPSGCGRDLARLASISAATGVDVVASTGFHLPRYYPPGAWPWSARHEQVVKRFVDELVRGVPVEGRGVVRAGVVKAAYTGSRSDEAARLLACACEASARTRAALVVHTERGAGVEQLADLLAEHGVRPHRVVLCHVDKRSERGLHEELAEAGFLLEYDTFLREQYAPGRNVWPLLEHLLGSGHGSSVACGLDLADASLWRFGGAPVGMVGLLTVVKPRLAALGASATEVDLLLRGNIAARLVRAKPMEAAA